MDEDLNDMSREMLVEEVQKLRAGIRKHRDSSGQELCWHNPALWSLLPGGSDPVPVVPDWPHFSAAASGTADRLTSRHQTRPGAVNAIASKGHAGQQKGREQKALPPY